MPTLLLSLSAAFAFDVVVHGVDGPGAVGCALYHTAEGFPGDAEAAAQAVAVDASKAVDGTITCHFEDPGVPKVAVAVRHDLDNDGKLDTNLVGFPTEPFGFSKDASLRTFGPPRFEDAAVEPVGTIHVNLRTRAGR